MLRESFIILKASPNSSDRNVVIESPGAVYSSRTLSESPRNAYRRVTLPAL